MRKLFLLIPVLMLSLSTFTSCRETKEKTVVIEKEAEKEEEKGILERAGEKADEEVNEEVDEAIDNIGDDN
ncbi:hypothetical protein HME9304_01635 [Flagellimonas maritima]|uniref:Uncharacterized protein n=1 Tax=Flagellimonas maritima TaxID=1383885 RepID=A0A2Z4LS80_9FLAO|nr:hypothetical protein [Allomuricauda aurantiaca]AWX44632.1 hypothetical protein HME9304_01635 [Allomuricauda aurantiaca]